RHALAADQGPAARGERSRVRRWLWIRRARFAAQECASDDIVHRLEKLHARFFRPRRRWRRDEAIWWLDGCLEFSYPPAEESISSAGRAAVDSLGLGREAQLCVYGRGPWVETLAVLRGLTGRMAGKGSGANRRLQGWRVTGRHQ